MTEREGAVPGPPRPDPLAAAADELAQVRERLIAAGRGEADSAEVGASLKEYLETHRPALQEAAASLGEEVRQQALAELYRWRAELEAQLAARRGEASTTGADDRADPRTTS